MNIIALILAICVIALAVLDWQQAKLIRRQQEKLRDAYNWIEPEDLVRGDKCNGDCGDCMYAEVDE